MKFDVSKIITESLLETTKEAEVITEVTKEAEAITEVTKEAEAITEVTKEADAITEIDKLEIMKGHYGNKLYDKLNPEKPDLAFETVKKLAKKNRELEGMGVKEHLAKAGQKAGENIKTTAAEAKDDVVGAGQKAAAVVKNVANDTGSVGEHLGKSVDKIKADAEEGVASAGHSIAKRLGNLDYGNTALAGSAAVAAGLGALALRKRLKKVK